MRSGIALQRSGANALTPSSQIMSRNACKGDRAVAPPGTKIVPVYDRSLNVTLSCHCHAWAMLFEESVVVALVCIVFLPARPQAPVAILYRLPVG